MYIYIYTRPNLSIPLTDLLSKLSKWIPKSNGLEYSRLGSIFLVSYFLILFFIFVDLLAPLGASWRLLAWRRLTLRVAS